jgi:hypothetical protein
MLSGLDRPIGGSVLKGSEEKGKGEGRERGGGVWVGEIRHRWWVLDRVSCWVGFWDAKLGFREKIIRGFGGEMFTGVAGVGD